MVRLSLVTYYPQISPSTSPIKTRLYHRFIFFINCNILSSPTLITVRSRERTRHVLPVLAFDLKSHVSYLMASIMHSKNTASFACLHTCQCFWMEVNSIQRPAYYGTCQNDRYAGGLLVDLQYIVSLTSVQISSSSGPPIFSVKNRASKFTVVRDKHCTFSSQSNN